LLAAWIASFAILLAALAPSISHAIAVAKGADVSWLEICTTDGAKVIKVAGQQSPASPSSSEKGMQSGHCPFCFTHADSVALLPMAPLDMPVVSGTYHFPTLFYQSSHPLFAWSSAQPRAPPAIS